MPWSWRSWLFFLPQSLRGPMHPYVSEQFVLPEVFSPLQVLRRVFHLFLKANTWALVFDRNSLFLRGLSALLGSLRYESTLRISVQFSSVTQSCLTLCDPMDYSVPGFPVHHQLLEFTQTHVHWLGGAIQPSHPLPCPSPPTFNLSQHQGLFKWVSSSHQMAKVL